MGLSISVSVSSDKFPAKRSEQGVEVFTPTRSYTASLPDDANAADRQEKFDEAAAFLDVARSDLELQEAQDAPLRAQRARGDDE